MVESSRPLCFGSSQANRSVFNTLSRHSPLAAVSRSTPIIILRLGSSASLSSLFSSSCYVGSHCSAFLSCLSCLLSSRGYMNQHAMWKYCIAHKWGRMHVYTEYARTKHTYIYTYIYTYIHIYIHIDNFPFSPQVWGSLRSPQIATLLRIHIIRGQRSVRIAPPSLPPHHSNPVLHPG